MTLLQVSDGVMASEITSAILLIAAVWVQTNCFLTTERGGIDFGGVQCLTTFTAGSGPGDSSTPPCDIPINNDLILEPDETFSLEAIILNNNGLPAQFSSGGDTASATIIDDEGILVGCVSNHLNINNYVGACSNFLKLSIVHPTSFTWFSVVVV